MSSLAHIESITEATNNIEQTGNICVKSAITSTSYQLLHPFSLTISAEITAK